MARSSLDQREGKKSIAGRGNSMCKHFLAECRGRQQLGLQELEEPGERPGRACGPQGGCQSLS